MPSTSGYVSLPDQEGTVVPAANAGSVTLRDNGSYSYDYKQGLFTNKYTLLVSLLASIGGLSFGYDQGVIANVLVMPTFFRMKAWETGIMTAVLELGALVGCILAGLFADRMGSRSRSIAAACVAFLVGSVIQAAARSVTHLVIGRGIGGIGVGALSMLSPLYLAEISPPSLRGSLMALEQLAIVSGVVLGFWLGFFTRTIPSSLSWRIPLAVQIIPGVILGLGCIILPPSPRLLVLEGSLDEAQTILARLRGRSTDDPLVKLELLEMQVEATLIRRTTTAESKPNTLIQELKTWAGLFGRKYRRRTWVGVLMMAFQQWSGINALLYYGPTLVRSIGLDGARVTLLVSGGIGIAQLVAVIPAIMFIDKLGRRPLLRSGAIVMGFSHFLVSILISQYGADWHDHSLAAGLSVGLIYVFTLAYGASFGPVAWVLPSEVFPLSMRSRGAALATSSNWANNFFVGLITPTTLERSPAGTFLLFAVFCFVAYLWATYAVPETAGIGLEEMASVFERGEGELEREEAETRRQIEEDVGLWRLVNEESRRGRSAET
ncbi:MFS monosaccharide transporter [Cylindrobasidium torrendii FP15055 ss-10]|uniref:MFS monosaccharide transporter n=1 Tax=Cylindrobasidium torrendii FP15055 ss-10 TaxID=1314674 RepID=A0A0D7BVL6_9AGAR|nr:MFS monosaccharide transporter [Cylindrobasidium torrendii FP15055 ss-10]